MAATALSRPWLFSFGSSRVLHAARASPRRLSAAARQPEESLLRLARIQAMRAFGLPITLPQSRLASATQALLSAALGEAKATDGATTVSRRSSLTRFAWSCDHIDQGHASRNPHILRG